jgi:cytochrome b6-f complex iron-sulfur subunit
MPEEDKKESPGSKSSELNRREFFIKVGGTSLAVAGAGLCVFGVRYLSPNVLYEPSPVVSAGKPEHYAANSVTLDPRLGVFIVRSAEGFYALNAVCTHLGCLTVWKPEAGVIACPCHGSTFQRDGSVIAGPAPRPLPWLKMWMADDGSLMVDRATIVPPQNEYVRA